MCAIYKVCFGDSQLVQEVALLYLLSVSLSDLLLPQLQSVFRDLQFGGINSSVLVQHTPQPPGVLAVLQSNGVLARLLNVQVQHRPGLAGRLKSGNRAGESPSESDHSVCVSVSVLCCLLCVCVVLFCVFCTLPNFFFSPFAAEEPVFEASDELFCDEQLQIWYITALQAQLYRFTMADYDPYLLEENKTAALQAEIDDTVDIMRNNINKVAERGEMLSSIDDNADNLAVSALGFKRGANRVRKQMWWKDLKMRMCLFLAAVLLLVVIIVPIVVHFS